VKSVDADNDGPIDGIDDFIAVTSLPYNGYG